MQPVIFPECNVTFGAGQQGVEPLPAHRTPDGVIVTKWKLTDEEIARVAETGHLHLAIHTHGALLQPVNLTVDMPQDLTDLRPSV